ncbi:hypothetical protein DF3PA_250019 [Candidatus Defluviicoccus seviourii]|uniref:Uncharacterized protein n=2 Tax=root TaxID=1 RepID=A0A564WE81_9PROT|nr:hypothetical protein DF3PB_280010 [uncultured Defluviicoccus sp.]VUX46611.1 hypothetical protein DF3PA_250019 [Candidatus Defluviicoccus seviourii]
MWYDVDGLAFLDIVRETEGDQVSAPVGALPQRSQSSPQSIRVPKVASRLPPAAVMPRPH